jgi:hypothetical protein
VNALLAPLQVLVQVLLVLLVLLVVSGLEKAEGRRAWIRSLDPLWCSLDCWGGDEAAVGLPLVVLLLAFLLHMQAKKDRQNHHTSWSRAAGSVAVVAIAHAPQSWCSLLQAGPMGSL